ADRGRQGPQETSAKKCPSWRRLLLRQTARGGPRRPLLNCRLGFGIFGAYSLPGAVVMQGSLSGAAFDGTGSSNALAPKRREARGRPRQAGRLGEPGPRAATRL